MNEPECPDCGDVLIRLSNPVAELAIQMVEIIGGTESWPEPLINAFLRVEKALLAAEAPQETRSQSSAWQPINSVPIDGRPVVVTDGTGYMWVVSAASYLTRPLSPYELPRPLPTHWMPLPAPPSNGGQD